MVAGTRIALPPAGCGNLSNEYLFACSFRTTSQERLTVENRSVTSHELGKVERVLDVACGTGEYVHRTTEF